MIRWYKELYMDEVVAKKPKKCKKAVMSRKPWKKSYFALMLANNSDNLFEIVQTRELFFRRYSYLDLYVFGLAANYDSAVELLQEIVEEEATKEVFDLRKRFAKEDFGK